MAGDWRDYAIDHGDGMVVFSIFRHSFDRVLPNFDQGIRVVS